MTPVWLERAFKDSVPRNEAFRRRRKEDLPARTSQTRPAGHEANLKLEVASAPMSGDLKRRQSQTAVIEILRIRIKQA
ncbi:hypothetical protein AHMF7605_02140 [Adhaeribacter arboris]|uniref:Uncharacterized protein n=1 Tax=Adhaeribacter arboris TaxID=2072846 RepID=A0A2T2YAE1_9BACT|nr:hypothetical protein AHMF7605_02140 [Adhaeribacter arboris]